MCTKSKTLCQSHKQITWSCRKPEKVNEMREKVEKLLTA